MARKNMFDNLKSLLDEQKEGTETSKDSNSKGPDLKNPKVPSVQAAIEDTKPNKRVRSLIKVSVEDCIPWKFADRHTSMLTDSKCEQLIEDIRKNGQEVPAIARKSKDQKGKFEIISGRRRLLACSKTKDRSIIIDLRDVDDKTASKIMLKENENRADISEFERSLNIYSQIKSEMWKSISEMRSAYCDIDNKKYSKTTFSRYVSAGELSQFSFIMKLITDPSLVKLTKAAELSDLMKASNENLEKIKAKAKYLAQKKNIYNKDAIDQLVEALKKKKAAQVNFYDVDGMKNCIEIKKTKKSVNIKLDQRALKNKKEVLNQLEEVLFSE